MDAMTDSKPARVVLCILQKLVVVMAWAACLGLSLAVLSGCTRRQAFPMDCQFDRQAGTLYRVEPDELNQRDPLVFVHRDGRRFAFKRDELVACQEVRP
jgi:hypothetical protein